MVLIDEKNFAQAGTWISISLSSLSNASQRNTVKTSCGDEGGTLQNAMA